MATIKQRANGAYQAVIRRKGYPQQSRTFDTWEDANDWAREVEVEIRRGEFKDRRNASNTTFRQVLEYYRDNYLDRCRFASNSDPGCALNFDPPSIGHSMSQVAGFTPRFASFSC